MDLTKSMLWGWWIGYDRILVILLAILCISSPRNVDTISSWPSNASPALPNKTTSLLRSSMKYLPGNQRLRHRFVLCADHHLVVVSWSHGQEHGQQESTNVHDKNSTIWLKWQRLEKTINNIALNPSYLCVIKRQNNANYEEKQGG